MDTQTDCQLTASLWSTEIAIAEFEQQNTNLLNALNSLKVSFRCANRSRANAKANAHRAESKLDILKKLTSDLFEDNKEVEQELEEATSKAESLQIELLEVKNAINLLTKKLDDYDLANKSFQESSTKKTRQITDQADVQKLVKQLNVLKDELAIQRAEAIQLIQFVDEKQYEKLEKYSHSFSTHASHCD